MNIMYLHGFSIRLTFLDYFTYIFFTERMSLGMRIVDAVIYDLIRQFQDPISIIHFDFVITSSSHQLSATWFFSKKK